MKHLYLTLAMLLFAVILLFVPAAVFAAAPATDSEITSLLARFGVPIEVSVAVTMVISAVLTLLVALKIIKPKSEAEIVWLYNSGAGRAYGDL